MRANSFNSIINFSKRSGRAGVDYLNIEQENIIITSGQQAIGERLDKFLHLTYPDITRSHFQILISDRLILVNNKNVKSGYRLRSGDQILVHFNLPAMSERVVAEKIPLDIVYEDPDLLVLNKPAGLVVHPGAGNRNGTLVNGLLYHCQTLSTMNGPLRPGIVHRLDKNTSGLLVVAKTDQTHLNLTRQFESRDIVRTYQAVVWGEFKAPEGRIESFIDRSRRNRQKMTVVKNHGKWALTLYQVLQSFRYFSFVELTLKTGRTHQIRVHLNHIHHPVFGDPEYNGRQGQLISLPAPARDLAAGLLKKINRQALHARRLSFIHPRSQKRVSFESNLPADIQQIVDELSTR